MIMMLSISTNRGPRQTVSLLWLAANAAQPVRMLRLFGIWRQEAETRKEGMYHIVETQKREKNDGFFS
ncbi:hypothetical protein A3709_19535 [Halioglobus sp. HI00S01]|nr:hypothetical protein A3709_19535 [Halioglobus sp. HI00S01]